MVRCAPVSMRRALRLIAPASSIWRRGLALPRAHLLALGRRPFGVPAPGLAPLARLLEQVPWGRPVPLPLFIFVQRRPAQQLNCLACSRASSALQHACLLQQKKPWFVHAAVKAHLVLSELSPLPRSSGLPARRWGPLSAERSRLSLDGILSLLSLSLSFSLSLSLSLSLALSLSRSLSRSFSLSFSASLSRSLLRSCSLSLSFSLSLPLSFSLCFCFLSFSLFSDLHQREMHWCTLLHMTPCNQDRSKRRMCNWLPEQAPREAPAQD